MRQVLLQNATAILLQNSTEVYYKMCQVFYYKIWQFNYKMRRLLQIATVQSCFLYIKNLIKKLLRSTLQNFLNS